MLRKVTIAALAAIVGGFFVPAAQAANKIVPLACETTTDTVGALDLAGAAGTFLSFSAAGMANGDTAYYQITNGAQRGEGLGTYTTGTPNTWTRDANENSTDGLDTPITLSGSSTICLGTASGVFLDGITAISVGSVDVASTTVPANGIYEPSANVLGFAVNTTAEMQLSATALAPANNDGLALGASANKWADLFLASGSVIDFNSGDVTITHAANGLSFEGGSSGYVFDAKVGPTTNDAAALGSATIAWADLFLAEGAVINWDNGDCTLTQTGNSLAVSGCRFLGSNTQPAGHFFWYTNATCPAYALPTNGAAVSRTTYADLFAVTSTTFGVGDGSTTFNVPDTDTNNRFIRAADGTTITIGTTQTSGAPDIDGTIVFLGDRRNVNNATGAFSLGGGNEAALTTGGGALGQDDLTFAASANEAIYSDAVSEIRPNNIALRGCITF